tara:strand:+ start:267 stop:506 length:240 start_codon:yes stop_codon:yes gene_type:complete
MDSNAWIALCAFALTVIGLLSSGVWLLATMKSSIMTLIRDQKEMKADTKDLAKVVTKHSEDCDHERVQFSTRLDTLESR